MNSSLIRNHTLTFALLTARKALPNFKALKTNLLICLPLLAKATEMRDQVVTEMMNRRERKVRSFAPTHLPFYLTSEEGGRNSIRGSLMSTVEKPGERNITCHKNVLLFRESNHQKYLSSASVVMLHVLAEFMALKRTIF